jgi:hypothetical protein
MGEMRNAYKILVRKPKGKIPVGRPRHRWEDNIGMDLKVVGWEGVAWMYLAQDTNKWWTLVNTVMNLDHYFVSQSNDFYRHNPLYCFSTSVCCCKHIFHYRLSPDIFGCAFVYVQSLRTS